MKKLNSFIRAGAMTALGLGLAVGVSAQDAEGKVNIGDAEGKATLDLPDRSDRERKAGVTDTDRTSITSEAQLQHRATHVGKLNKATGLLGMNVVNRQNEKLGAISDVVVDLESGKISYVVLSAGGFLGIGDKLVAIPPSAFSVSETQEGLVLNADKAKLESIPTLTKEEWPQVRNPHFAVNWDADADAVGGTVTGEQGRLRSNDRDREGASVTTQGNIRNVEESQRSRNISSQSERGGADSQAFRGRIVAIDPEKRTMKIEGDSGAREFTFTEKPTISLGNSNKNPKLVDLRVGFPVSVGYHQEGDEYMAHSVIRTDPPSTR